MPANADRSACLVVSIQTTEAGPLLKILSAVLDILESRHELHNVPIHWSFPACALESRRGTETRLVPIMKERLANRRDMLLPRGYSGAPHTLLLSEDIKRDLEWAVTNPWQSGIEDIFKGSDPIVFPVSPDMHRESIRSVYKTEPDRLLLEIHDADTGSTLFLLKIDDQGLEQNSLLLPLFRNPAEMRNSKGLKKDLLRHFRTWETAALIPFDVCPGTPPEQIVSHIDFLDEVLALGVGFQNLTEIAKTLTPTGKCTMHAIPVLSTPSDAFGRSMAGYSRTEINASARNLSTGKRARRQNRSTTRQRLKTISPAGAPKLPPPLELGVPNIVDRTLIADMFGTVSLFDGDVSVRFEEGQLTGIMLRNEPILCGRPVSSYYIEESGRYDFTNNGAFSFEGEIFHGLRATQSIHGNGITRGGSVVHDFFFLDRESSLFISTVCIRPTFARDTLIRTWACFELPLFELNRTEPVSIESRTLDGEKWLTDLTGCVGDYLFSGSAFRLRNDKHSVFITYPESDNNMTQLLPVRIKKSGRKSIVSINPGGCYLPASSARYGGYADHTVIAIDVQKADTDTYPKVRSDVFSETGPQWFRFTG